MRPTRAPKPTFFKTPAEFRAWLEQHHATASELVVGFYKRDSGTPSITWPESVDQALCFGWIDGVRRSAGDEAYTIRFSPRRTRSIWSAINIKRVAALSKAKLMRPAGHKAFDARREYRSGIYAYEQRSPELPPEYAKHLGRNKAALKYFEAQPPYYRKVAMWWIVSAKKGETRLKRLRELIALSGRGKRLPGFDRNPPKRT